MQGQRRFGKEDTAKELQDHAADTQDTLVDAVENAEVAEIKRAVFRPPFCFSDHLCESAEVRAAQLARCSRARFLGTFL